MTDFRTAPHPSELTWTAPRGNGKSKTAGATYAGRKMLIQTPVCAARVFRDTTSTTMYLSLHGVVQKQFGDFVQTYETYAATLPHVQGIELSPCLRNDSFRLVVWDDAQWFDEHGTYVKQPPASVHACAVLLEFQGCWVSGAKWGLKWKATQIRVEKSPPTVEKHAGAKHTGAKHTEAKQTPTTTECMLIDD